MASATFEKLSKVLNKIDINLVVNDLIMINLPGLDVVFRCVNSDISNIKCTIAL
jgi:hypothetical protein